MAVKIKWTLSSKLYILCGVLLIGSVVWIIWGPEILLNMHYKQGMSSKTYLENGTAVEIFNSGKAGDSISGTITPIITLVSVIFLFITIVLQIEGFKVSQYAGNYAIMKQEIKDLALEIEKIKYYQHTGSVIIGMSYRFAHSYHNNRNLVPALDDLLNQVQNIQNKTIVVLEMLVQFDFSESNKKAIFSELGVFYTNHFAEQLKSIGTEIKINESIKLDNDDLNNKCYSLLKQAVFIKGAFEDIINISKSPLNWAYNHYPSTLNKQE